MGRSGSTARTRPSVFRRMTIGGAALVVLAAGLAACGGAPTPTQNCYNSDQRIEERGPDLASWTRFGVRARFRFCDDGTTYGTTPYVVNDPNYTEAWVTSGGSALGWSKNGGLEKDVTGWSGGYYRVAARQKFDLCAPLPLLGFICTDHKVAGVSISHKPGYEPIAFNVIQ